MSPRRWCAYAERVTGAPAAASFIELRRCCSEGSISKLPAWWTKNGERWISVSNPPPLPPMRTVPPANQLPHFVILIACRNCSAKCNFFDEVGDGQLEVDADQRPCLRRFIASRQAGNWNSGNCDNLIYCALKASATGRGFRSVYVSCPLAVRL